MRGGAVTEAVARPTAEARAKHFITTAESLEEKYSMRGVGDYGGGPQNMLRSLQSRHERLLQPALPPPTCLAGANPTLSPFAWKTKFKSKPFGGGAGVCGERCILREAALERLGAGANNQDFGLTRTDVELESINFNINLLLCTYQLPFCVINKQHTTQHRPTFAVPAP